MALWVFVITGSSNGLVPVWHQAITWTSGDLLSTGPLGTKFNDIWLEIKTLSLKQTNEKK